MPEQLMFLLEPSRRRWSARAKSSPGITLLSVAAERVEPSPSGEFDIS